MSTLLEEQQHNYTQENINIEETHDNNQKDVIEVFETLKEYAVFAYEQEVKREESMKLQANNMQSAFSFVSAAVVMSIPVIYQYKGELSYLFLFSAFSTILIALGLSLLFATLSLKLMKQDACLNILEQKEYFAENFDALKEKTARLDYWLKYYDKLQSAKRKSIEVRIKYLNWSRYMFISSLFLCFFWFITSVIYFTTM